MLEIDYSILDRAEILQFIFYPRDDWSPPPQGASDHFVDVADKISVACRFYTVDQHAPSILYFHGNGEVVADYDWVAPFYTNIGVNLFVADFRGYGQSGGSPSFTTMISDSRAIYAYFCKLLDSDGFDPRLFVMGRSLGAHCAVEITCRFQTELQGLILESGFASVNRLIGFLADAGKDDMAEKVVSARLARIRSITLPVLIIHGDWDVLVPPDQAKSFYKEVGAEDKRLITIHGAGHNDIMHVGMDRYFSSIKDFVFGGDQSKEPGSA